jgi:hypothetical protein
MNIKKLGIILTLGSLLAFSHAPTANAHILRTDGDFRAEIHIPPYDHPLSGEPTTYLITFEATPEGFSVAECTCTVDIVRQGKIIATKPLAMPVDEISKNVFTFPEAGEYSVHVSGQPKQAGKFSNFMLNYPARLKQGKPATTPIPIAVWIGAGTGIGAIIVAGIWMEQSGRKSALRR